MKHVISVACMASIMVCLAACEKSVTAADKSEVTAETIMGKWNIVSDSTFAGVGLNNHAVDYAGVTGDYFDFRADGHIYIKENASLDTLSYSNVSTTTITIQAFGGNFNGVQEASNITALSNDNIIIAAPKVFTPGGIFGRTIHLAR